MSEAAYKRQNAQLRAQRDEAREQLQRALDKLEGTRAELRDLARKCDSLTALLAQAEADNRAWAERCRWIPVGEKMPAAGTYVLARDADLHMDMVSRDSAGHWWRSSRPLGAITHWRPLDPGPDAT